MGKVYMVDVVCELPNKEKRTYEKMVMDENLLDSDHNKARIIALIYERKSKKYFDNFHKVKMKLTKIKEIKGILEDF